MVLLASNFDKSRFSQGRRSQRREEVPHQEGDRGGDRNEQEGAANSSLWFTNDERGLRAQQNQQLRTFAAPSATTCAGWAGKIIVVFPTMVDMRGKMVPALRVRIPPPKQATAGNGQPRRRRSQRRQWRRTHAVVKRTASSSRLKPSSPTTG